MTKESKERITEFQFSDEPVLRANVMGLRRGAAAFGRLALLAYDPRTYAQIYSETRYDAWEDEDTIVQVLEEARNVWKPLSDLPSEVPTEDEFDDPTDVDP